MKDEPQYLWDGVGKIWEEGNVEPAQSSLRPRGVHPRVVGEVGIHAASYNLYQSQDKLTFPYFSYIVQCNVSTV